MNEVKIVAIFTNRSLPVIYSLRGLEEAIRQCMTETEECMLGLHVDGASMGAMFFASGEKEYTFDHAVRKFQEDILVSAGYC